MSQSSKNVSDQALKYLDSSDPSNGVSTCLTKGQSCKKDWIRKCTVEMDLVQNLIENDLDQALKYSE